MFHHYLPSGPSRGHLRILFAHYHCQNIHCHSQNRGFRKNDKGRSSKQQIFYGPHRLSIFFAHSDVLTVRSLVGECLWLAGASLKQNSVWQLFQPKPSDISKKCLTLGKLVTSGTLVPAEAASSRRPLVEVGGWVGWGGQRLRLLFILVCAFWRQARSMFLRCQVLYRGGCKKSPGKFYHFNIWEYDAILIFSEPIKEHSCLQEFRDIYCKRLASHWSRARCTRITRFFIWLFITGKWLLLNAP